MESFVQRSLSRSSDRIRIGLLSSGLPESIDRETFELAGQVLVGSVAMLHSPESVARNLDIFD